MKTGQFILWKKGNKILIKHFKFQGSFCSLFLYGSAAWLFLDQYSYWNREFWMFKDILIDIIFAPVLSQFPCIYSYSKPDESFFLFCST